jgi:DNA-binding CsgD family transcriptional regulator
MPHLTRRQAQIVQLLGDGHTQDQISDDLDISRSTVNSHLANARRSLGAHTSAELVAQAYRLGYVDPPLNERQQDLSAAVDKFLADQTPYNRARMGLAIAAAKDAHAGIIPTGEPHDLSG